MTRTQDASTTVTLTLDTTDAAELLRLLTFRPLNERWSRSVYNQLRGAFAASRVEPGGGS